MEYGVLKCTAISVYQLHLKRLIGVVCVHACILYMQYTYKHKYMHTQTHTYRHAYIHTYTHTHTHTHTHTYIHIYYTHRHTCIYTHTYIHTYTHTTHTCMHAYAHMHTYTHILCSSPVIQHWHQYFLAMGSATHGAGPAWGTGPLPMPSALASMILQDQSHLLGELDQLLQSHLYH